MSSKFNTEFLNSEAKKNVPNLDNFKTPSEMFGKANSAIDIIPIDSLVPFSNHPFKIRDGERLDELTESIKEQGVLVPLIVRLHKTQVGRYEILAGHHRMVGASRAGLTELPCIIKNADDNTAVLIVVESNKQRGFADMLPSEIAKALKMEYEALKCQGKRTDLMAEMDEFFQEENADKPSDNSENSHSCTLCTKIDTAKDVGAGQGMSRRNTYYYIRLNDLSPAILEMVDIGTIAIHPAVDLSYLPITEQQYIIDVLEDCGYKVDMKKAEKLKEYSLAGKLNEDTAKLILSGAVFEVKAKKVTSVKLPVKKLKAYIPTSVTAEEYEQYVLTALEFYKNNHREDDCSL